MKTCIIVPIKTNSKRLPGKTFKELGGIPLYKYLFKVLSKQTSADIYIDSSDEIILDLASKEGFRTLKRPEEYNSDSTAGDDLIKRVINDLDYEVVGLLHITSPFLSKETVEASIKIIEEDGSIDSLFGVVSRYNRFWYKNSPVNHDVENLVRTQDLEPVQEEADFYFFRKEAFLKHGRRVCGNRKTYEVSVVESVDIDTIEDFVYAESLLNSGLLKNS